MVSSPAILPTISSISRASTAAATAIALDLPVEAIKSGLESFNGTVRRFEKKGELNGFTIIDDYAHHPDEIKTTLLTAKNYPHAKLWCVFQPHTYTRTKAFFDEFVETLSLADAVVFADIYAAREINTIGISSKDDSIEEIIKSVDILQEKLNCRYIMTTLSERGVLIKDYATSTCHHIPAHIRKIADVSGAGDTVLSVAMLCLACNQNAYNIAALSNLAGGIVCEEVGVIPINKEHLFEESKKIS